MNSRNPHILKIRSVPTSARFLSSIAVFLASVSTVFVPLANAQVIEFGSAPATLKSIPAAPATPATEDLHAIPVRIYTDKDGAIQVSGLYGEPLANPTTTRKVTRALRHWPSIAFNNTIYGTHRKADDSSVYTGGVLGVIVGKGECWKYTSGPYFNKVTGKPYYEESGEDCSIQGIVTEVEVSEFGVEIGSGFAQRQLSDGYLGVNLKGQILMSWSQMGFASRVPDLAAIGVRAEMTSVLRLGIGAYKRIAGSGVKNTFFTFSYGVGW